MFRAGSSGSWGWTWELLAAGTEELPRRLRDSSAEWCRRSRSLPPADDPRRGDVGCGDSSSLVRTAEPPHLRTISVSWRIATRCTQHGHGEVQIWLVGVP